jgi:hypothetical protein
MHLRGSGKGTAVDHDQGEAANHKDRIKGILIDRGFSASQIKT